MNTFKNEPTGTPVKLKRYLENDFSDFPAPLRIIVKGKKEPEVFSAKPDNPKPSSPGQPKPENPNPKPSQPKPVTKEEEQGGYTLPGDRPHEPGDKPMRPVERNKALETAPEKNEEEDDEEDEDYDMDEEREDDELNEEDDEKEFDKREDTAF